MIPLCHTENALKRGKKSRNVASFLNRGQIGVSIIDSIPHCHTENGQKLVNYASFLYRRKQLEYLSSIVFHTVVLKML